MINKIAFLLITLILVSANGYSETCTLDSINPTSINIGESTEVTATFVDFADPPLGDSEVQITCAGSAIASNLVCTGDPDYTCTLDCGTYDSAGSYTIESLKLMDATLVDCTGTASLTVNAAPTIDSASVDPQNVNEGSDVTFLVDWADDDAGELAKIHICKTDSLTNGACDGGAWCETTNPADTDLLECSYSTQNVDVSTQNYFAFVCDDDDACSNSSTGTFEVNAKPTANLTANPLEGQSTLTVTFTGSCNDTDGTIQSCQIDFGDGSDEVGFTSEMPHDYDFEGEYAATLTATDDDGATETDSESIVVDDTAPSINNKSPEPDSYTNDTTPTISFDIDDSGSGVDIDSMALFIDGDPEMSDHEEFSGNYHVSWTPNTALSDGTVSVGVRVEDNLGNSADANWNFIVDTEASSSLDIKIDSGNSYTNDRDVSLSLSASGASQCRFKNDGEDWSAWDNYSSSKSWTLRDSDGARTVYFKCRDTAGNVSGEDSDDITLDRQGPDKPEYLNVTYDEDDDEVDLSWDESDDDYSGIDYYEVYRGTNSDFDDMESQATNTDRSYSEDDLVDGKRYYYRVRAKDNAGNYSTESDYVSVVFGEEEQRPKPTVEWTEPDDDDDVSGVVELEARATADSSTSIRRVRFYANDSYLGDGTKSGSYYTFDWNTLAEDDGDYELKAISLDWYGISSDPDKIDVTVDNVPETDGVRADAQAAINEADDAKEAAASLFADFEAVGASPSSEAASLLSDGSLQLEDAQDLFDDEDYEGAEEKALQAKEKFDGLLEMLSIEEYGEGQEYVYNEEHLELLLKGLGFSQGLVDEVKEIIEDYTVGRSLSVKAVKEKYSTSYRAVITVTVKNDSGEAKQVKVIEVIPKELAENASLISGEGFEVIVEDPVLQWQLQLEAGEEAEIVYFLKDDLTAEQANELLESAVLSKFAVPPVLAKPDTEIAAESFSGAAAGLFGLGAGLEWLGWIVLAVIVVLVALLAFNYLRGMEREGSGLGASMPRTGPEGGFFGRLRPGKREEKPQGPKWQYRG